MKKQKICIIGGSLTGLITSIALSKLNCEIDIITGSTNANLKSSRTTAISQNNLEFLNELDISNLLKKELWACTNMKLYTENHNKKTLELLDFNINKVNKKVLYMMENKKIRNILMNQIKKNKLISLIKNKNISQINDSGILKSVKLEKKFIKYNLIIICTGNNSALVKNFFKDQIIEDSYNEMSLTAVLKHDTLKNDTARQFFYNKEILALLPISNTRTSVVYFIKKNNKQNNLFYKNKIKSHVKNYFKNIIFESNIEYGEANFLIRKNYFKDRTLLFGDALHVIHPFAGQGFNMVLRDLKFLKDILDKKISLGLDIGSLDVLSEFSKKTKLNNFAFSIGLDILKKSFSVNNKFFNEGRNNLLQILNKNNYAKNIFYNIANEGLKL
tara:strand:- start:8974 stop:10134 length:1161 start_codon:yes stop_codon:yes gene_type:complete